MSKPRTLLWLQLSLTLLALGTAASAQSVTEENAATDPIESKDVSTNDTGPFRYFDVAPGLRVWGGEADFTFGFRFVEGLDTALWLRLSAAYGEYGFYRLPDGSIFDPRVAGGSETDPSSARTQSDRFNLRWGAGILQGLHFNEEKDRNDLDLLLAWTAWMDVPDTHEYAQQPLLQLSDYPGTNAAEGAVSLLLHTLLLDLLYDGTEFDNASKTKQGLWVDTGITWAPEAMNYDNGANYLRFSAAGKAFVPLFKNVDANKWNLFSGYFAAYLGFDQLLGLGDEADQGIPYPMSQYFGSRFYRDGLGGSLRGLGDGYLDGTTKLIGNIELRLIGPAFIAQNINPIAVIYVDAGYFANPPGLPANSDPDLVSGFRAATGIGIFLNVLDIGAIGVYTQYVLYGNKYDGSQWTPITIGFDMHF